MTTKMLTPIHASPLYCAYFRVQIYSNSKDEHEKVRAVASAQAMNTTSVFVWSASMLTIPGISHVAAMINTGARSNVQGC